LLEVGTGSGYQAAVLSELTDRVFSIEIKPELARAAAARLKELGYGRVRVQTGDGYQGWPEEAPFDAILVTAAAPQVPPALAAQLKEGGRLVILLGEAGGDHTLVQLRKVKGELKEEKRARCASCRWSSVRSEDWITLPNCSLLTAHLKQPPLAPRPAAIW
jgi:protein-L-isoaspartate(D-aspartate) O-methyltransferase